MTSLRQANLTADREAVLALVAELHEAAGSALAKAWTLPETVVVALAQHHAREPDKQSVPVRIVSLADRFAHLTAEGALSSAALAGHPALAALEIYPDVLDKIIKRGSVIKRNDRSHVVSDRFDLIVIGGGPAGQKAAVQGAKLGKTVLLIERSRSVGGACVRFGTIPSKTLRETALALGKFRRLTSHVMDVKMPEHTQIESLMTRKEEVILSHESYMGAQLSRNGIEQAQGVARFLSANELEISDISGAKRRVSASFFVVATGSSPRTPDDVPIDHEHILDSDSILSVSYLPQSMTVLGSGVIAWSMRRSSRRWARR